MPCSLRLLSLSVAAALASLAMGGCGDPTPLERAPDVVNSLAMRLVHVPAGTFVMGSSPDEPGRSDNEGPRHRVRIRRGFHLGATEVTVGQFSAFAEATGYLSDAERDEAGGFGIDFDTGDVTRVPGITWRAPGFPGFEPGAQHPAVLLSWQDAEAFCAWLSEKEGRTYRLPTEAEWEYAARAGSDTAYGFGTRGADLARHANVADASLHAVMPAATGTAPWDDGHPFLAPVGSFRANAWGLHDMHGNVWEWCADWYGKDYYAWSDVDDPAGPPGGGFRSIRGGGWLNGAARNRAAQRVYFDPRFRYCLLSGFRVLLESEGADG